MESGSIAPVNGLLDPATGLGLAVLLTLYIASALVLVARQWPRLERRHRWLLAALPFIFTPFLAAFPALVLVGFIALNVAGLTWPKLR